MKLFVHPIVRRTYDYGDLLSEEHGIGWSHDGDPWHVTGFERRTIEEARTKVAKVAAEHGEPIDLVVG